MIAQERSVPKQDFVLLPFKNGLANSFLLQPAARAASWCEQAG